MILLSAKILEPGSFISFKISQWIGLVFFEPAQEIPLPKAQCKVPPIF